jgi:hypothetical protein
MSGAVPPFPQHVFMAWCLIKQWIRVYGVLFNYVLCDQITLISVGIPIITSISVQTSVISGVFVLYF